MGLVYYNIGKALKRNTEAKWNLTNEHQERAKQEKSWVGWGQIKLGVGPEPFSRMRRWSYFPVRWKERKRKMAVNWNERQVSHLGVHFPCRTSQFSLWHCNTNNMQEWKPEASISWGLWPMYFRVVVPRKIGSF